jgi:hypothetical protein
MSKLIPKFIGTIQNGTLTLNSPESFKKYVSNLKSQKVVMIVKPYRKTRTVRQNAYYWLCLTFIGDEIGESPDDLHTTFKSLFLTDHTGKFPMIRSTSRLNVVQFGEYLDKVIRKVAEIGIVVPDPEQMEIEH